MRHPAVARPQAALHEPPARRPEPRPLHPRGGRGADQGDRVALPPPMAPPQPPPARPLVWQPGCLPPSPLPSSPLPSPTHAPRLPTLLSSPSYHRLPGDLQAHSTMGNKWSTIAKQLPGRTDNSIKNRWHALVSGSTSQYAGVEGGRHLLRRLQAGTTSSADAGAGNECWAGVVPLLDGGGKAQHSLQAHAPTCAAAAMAANPLGLPGVGPASRLPKGPWSVRPSPLCTWRPARHPPHRATPDAGTRADLLPPSPLAPAPPPPFQTCTRSATRLRTSPPAAAPRRRAPRWGTSCPPPIASSMHRWVLHCCSYLMSWDARACCDAWSVLNGPRNPARVKQAHARAAAAHWACRPSPPPPLASG